MKQVKLQVSRSVIKALQELADKRGDSLSDTLRHAVNTEVYINEQIEKGADLLCRDSSGKTWKVVLTHTNH